MKKTMLKLTAALLAAAVMSGCANTDSTVKGTSVAQTSETEAEGFTGLSISAVDDGTFEVKLNSVTPYFLELTSFPTFMPIKQDTVEANGDAWATQADSYITSGAYKLTEYTPGYRLVYEKNENYWDAANVKPNKISYTLTDDQVAQYDAFEKGTMQFIDEIPTNEYDTISKEESFHTMPMLGTYFQSFNTQKEPFDNPLVRKAFSLAIDRERIARTIAKGWTAAGSYVALGTPDADPGSSFREVGGDFIDPSADAYEANKKAAQEALAEAGYPNGEGFPNVEYLYAERDIYKPVAESLQSMWKDVLNVNVSITSQEWATLLSTRKNGEYQITTDRWINDYSDPIGMLDLFTSHSGNNDPQYRSPEYDALIAKIKLSNDSKERFALMHQAEELLLSDYAIAPYLYYTDYYMIDPQFAKSLIVNPLGWKFFREIDTPELSVCGGPNPDTIDPALNTALDSGIMVLTGFEGLYRYNRAGILEPALAESVTVSDDGLTYTFKLRDGLKWSDGTPLTAKDFVYAWNRAADPATGSDYQYIFSVVDGFVESGDE
ncbi:hypothetical protein FACS1894120_0330 [Clostridia bacterium]|nr:hypothetical protein FACS1894120_0330 [Clostridia bacterium]